MRVYRAASGAQLVVTRSNGPSMTVSASVRVGSANETEMYRGISHVLEHILFHGCEGVRTQQDVMSLFDSMGAAHNAFTSQEETYYYATGPPTYVYRLFNLLLCMLFSPIIREEDVEKEKLIVVEEIRMRDDNALSVAEVLGVQTLLAGHSAGNKVAGSEEQVMAITLDRILEYWNTWYHPENCLFIVACPGDVDVRRLRASVDNISIKPVMAVAELRSLRENMHLRARTVQEFRPTQQYNIVLCFPAPSLSDVSYMATALAVAAMGGYGSSRLYMGLRADKGLAYTVRAEYFSILDAGVVVVYGGFAVEHAALALSTLRGVVYGDSFSVDEVCRAKRNTVNRMRQFTSADVAMYVRDHGMHGGRMPSLARTMKQYRLVSHAAVVHAQNQVFDPTFEITCVVQNSQPGGEITVTG
jgi:predicted Zn-dependent peptidase